MRVYAGVAKFGSAAVFWLIVGLKLDCYFVQSKFKQLAGVFRDDVIGFGETDSAKAPGHRISGPSHSLSLLYPQRGGLRTTIHTYIYNTHCSKKQQLFSIAYSSLPERDCVSSKWLCAGLGSESWWTACGFCNFAQHALTCKHKTPELVTVSLLVLTADICIRMNCIDAHVPFWWTEEK